MSKLGVMCLVAVGFIGSATLWAGEPRFPMVVLDASYVGYERDVADVNGDGANDIVCVSEDENSVRTFLAPDWRNVVLVTPAGPFTWPRADDFKACDLDRDGDADLIVRLGPDRQSDAAGIAAWFENQGAAGWRQHTIGNSPGYVKDICVADLDRDGRPDVVMRREHETELYFQEPDRWTTVSLTHTGREGLEVADLDLDGDPDLILNGFWYPTPDTPAAARSAASYVHTPIDSAWFSQSGDWTANACKVVAGDFDGDGRTDVAFSQAERAGHAVTWYNSPTPRVAGSWTAHPIAVVDFCHNLQAADWDRDGDTDLLVGGMVQSAHRGLKFLLNDGAGRNWSESLLQAAGSYSAELGDVDNDGDLDIVGIRNWNAAPTYLYRNETACRNETAGPARLDRWSYVQVSAAHERTFGLCFPDLDGDGDREIASGRFVYRNPGAPLTGAWEQIALPGGVHAFATLDVDGDRFVDLLAQRDAPSANRLELVWIESADPAGSSWSAPQLIGSVPRSEHAEGFQGYRVAALFPGDKPGIVVSTRQGICYFAVPPTNPAAGNWPRTRIAPNDSDEGIGVADIDGDGDLDVSFTSGQTKQVLWARNPGRRQEDWEVVVVGQFPEADWPDCCAAADLNGDGRVDILVTEENAGQSADALACWWEQPAAGAMRGVWPRHTLATQYTMNNLDVGDVDRDGDLDVVLAEHRGTKRIAVWANDGRGVFSEHRVGEGQESHLGGRLADLDGDGDLDLVSIAYDDFRRLHVWRNDSSGNLPRAVTEQAQPPAVTEPAPRRMEPATARTDAAPSLAAHWAFDERSGDEAADSGGGGREGRVVGATWAAGRHGGGLRFGGQSDRVECGIWDVDGEAITLAAWIKCDPDSADNDARILSKAVGSQEQDHWWMLSTAAEGGERRLRVRLKAGGSTTTLIAARGHLAPDVWTHVAASYDGAHLRLFVDGAEAGSVPKTGRLDTNTSAAVWIGANPPDGYAPFRGLIDDVWIYRSAMTGEGLAAVMQGSPGSANRAASQPDTSSSPASPPPANSPQANSPQANSPQANSPQANSPPTEPPAGTSAVPAQGPDGVTISEDTDEGMACFKVVAVAGSVQTTYYYSKTGAAFSSLLDNDGADWIGHRPEGGSAGHFRGIPNLGDDFGHPHSSGATSTTGDPLGVRLAQATITSAKGGWKSVWEFFATHARMTLTSAGGAYWLLYEGTPGGSLGGDDFIWLCNGERFSCCDYVQGRRYNAAIRNTSGVAAGSAWAVFADGVKERSLVYLHTADEAPDEYWQMQNNMTVFGFGRTGLRRHLTPAAVPQTLVLALLESREPAKVSGLIDRLWKAP